MDSFSLNVRFFAGLLSALGYNQLVFLVPVVLGFLLYSAAKSHWPFRFSPRQRYWRLFFLWILSILLTLSIVMLGLFVFVMWLVTQVDP